MMIAYDAAVNKLRDVLNRIFGEAWSLSCPMPGVVNGIPVDKHFLYPVASGPSQSRPFALVISAMDTGTILILRHCAADDFVDTAAHPFDTPISGALPRKMGVKEYKDGMRQLRESYENLRRSVFESGTPAGRGETAFEEYLALVEGLTPAAHGPYYAAMGGEGTAAKS